MVETLQYNRKSGDFYIITHDVDKAVAIGMTLSTSTKGPHGESVFFTTDPYAALAYWDCASGEVKLRLKDLHDDYNLSWAATSDKDYACPRGLSYMGYQKAGIEYALKREHCVIGDEMGLGKTVEAIGIANASNARNVLIVCPASIRLGWEREIKKWSTIPRVLVHCVESAKSGVNPSAAYTVISYNMATNPDIHIALMKQNWDLVVIDEIHFLKSPTALRTRAVFGGGPKEISKVIKGDNFLEDPNDFETVKVENPFHTQWVSQKAKRVVGLTGTLLPNRPRECYTVADALCPEAIDFASYDAFANRYNPEVIINNRNVGNFTGRLEELQNRLRCNFMIRRLKKDVLKDLPKVRYELSYLEPNGAIRRALKKEAMLDFSIDDLVDPSAAIEGEISTVRREMGEAKVPLIISHIDTLVGIMGCNKVALYCHHRSVMDALLESKLSRYGIAMLRGGMSVNNKQEAVDRFMKDDNCRIFLGQNEAAGVGVDGLQKVCDHVVIAEPAWRPGDNNQIIARLDRMGQKSSVLAQFLMVEGSLDERVLSRAMEKSEGIHLALDAKTCLAQ